ncbi:hypothetical protein PMIN06_007402 [Paraphaeosphaeria minitans]|uniref:Oxidase ustYa n=1 Tax=Paraphaeosphaeria minitans TaxID=565426 RepID=A0A9P6G9R9_9PLEO|nr:hypothetical protein PMIN01_10330 [Paraphaeosphaeria minitans]
MAFFERFKRRPDGRYTSLLTDENEPDTPTKPAPRVRREGTKGPSWKSVTSHISFLLLGILFGIAWSHWSVGGFSNDGYFPPSGNPFPLQVWFENSTFTGEPSALTQSAWASLIPKGKGFVEHPHIASPPKAVAAYHQIHCLHGIRIAYYSRVNELHKLQGKLSLVNHYIENMGALGADLHLYHLDHCFEYLRQALMCAADSNLEDVVVDERTGTAVAPGWGTERVCRDFERLGRWSERWRASDDETIL